MLYPYKLSESARMAILNEKCQKVVSVVSFWEISIKMAKGKMSLDGIEIDEFADSVKMAGFNVIDLTLDDTATYNKLEQFDNHKDPFDRMLIWQAINNNLTMISKDEKFKQYKALNILW
jgi:PIN domain nuclease of toxin-antitoxin system